MTFDVIRSTPRLAPELAEGHLGLGYFIEDGALDFTQAHEDFERALALAPGDGTVLRLSGGFLVSMGRQFDEGIFPPSAAQWRWIPSIEAVTSSLAPGYFARLSGGDSGLCRHTHP